MLARYTKLSYVKDIKPLRTTYRARQLAGHKLHQLYTNRSLLQCCTWSADSTLIMYLKLTEISLALDQATRTANHHHITILHPGEHPLHHHDQFCSIWKFNHPADGFKQVCYVSKHWLENVRVLTAKIKSPMQEFPTQISTVILFSDFPSFSSLQRIPPDLHTYSTASLIISMFSWQTDLDLHPRSLEKRSSVDKVIQWA